MTKINDGNMPVFPVDQETEDGIYHWYGMSLRDHFAGQALNGILSNPSLTEVLGKQATIEKVKAVDLAATICFEYADAMIKAKGEQ